MGMLRESTEYRVVVTDAGGSFDLHVDDGFASPVVVARIGDLPINETLNSLASPLAADVLDMGFAIVAADRLCLRGVRTKAQGYGYWSRRIHITVSVRFPEVWAQPGIRNSLKELLGFLTDDDWHFEFARRSDSGRIAERGFCPTLFPPKRGNHPAVILFSGGIDSAYGLRKLIDAGHDVLHPVTITNNGRVAHLRDSVLSAVMATRSASFAMRPVSTWMHLSHHDRDSLLGISMEESARARAIQFILAGAAFAINCGTNTLYVAENGIGAIGLPMTSDHFGSRATKAIHPRTLSLASDLIETISERAFTIRNLGFHLTKGQMVSELASSQGGAEVLARTSTCDRRKYRGRLSGCGECTSCLSRYAGFIAAGQEDPMRYAVRPTLDPAYACRGGLCLEYQAYQYREILQSPEPMRAFVEQFPQARDIISNIESADTLMSLLRHHSNEILAFAAAQERSSHAA